jgi:hypothetical protein
MHKAQITKYHDQIVMHAAMKLNKTSNKANSVHVSKEWVLTDSLKESFFSKRIDLFCKIPTSTVFE